MPDKVSRSYVLRFAGLYGPDRHLLLNKVIKGEMMNGRAIEFLIFFIEMMLQAQLSVASGSNCPNRYVFNVSDGRHATRGEIVQWLADKMNLQNQVLMKEKSQSAKSKN